MTIEELKIEATKTKQKIEQSLVDFNKKTGIDIQNVYFRRIVEMGNGIVAYNVELEINL